MGRAVGTWRGVTPHSPDSSPCYHSRLSDFRNIAFDLEYERHRLPHVLSDWKTGLGYN